MPKLQKVKAKRGRGTEADKIKMDLRRQRVFEMRAKGLSIAVIAEALGVTTRTVDLDVAAIRTQEISWLEKSRNKFDAESYWIDRKRRLETRLKEMWVGLSEQKTDRASIAREMREIEAELEMMLTKMGIVTTTVDPEKLITDTIRIVHEYPEDQE